MKSLKKDTLAYQLGVRPGVQRRDMQEVPLPQVVTQLNKFMGSDLLSGLVDTPVLGVIGDEKACGNPERDAVVFYLLNHAVSLVRQNVHIHEPLGDRLPIMDLYHEQLATRATRMFYYLLLICTRESRHDKAGYSSSLWINLRETYGEAIYNFHGVIRSASSSAAADALRSKPPEVSIGKFTSFLSELFHKGSYSSGYGGPAWGAVADVLRDFVHGKITAEMMMDTAFTLCHNNGPIFNKGMLFEAYSHGIYKILDVQRSGQIPQMVANNETIWAKDPVVSVAWVTCHHILGKDFEGHVDWFTVEELGSLNAYKQQKDAQVSKYGYPSNFKAKIEAEKAKKELAAKKAETDEKDMIEIMVGLKLKKVEVPREQE